MGIFQRFIQLYILFGAINIIHLTDGCYCHEDCDALTNVINQLNQQRRQPSPDKKFLHNETDTSTCKRNTKCCVPATPTPVCRDGWTMHKRSCFLFIRCNGKCSPNQARNSCINKQSHLAKVSSPSHEQLFTLKLKTSNWILLGGNDRDKEGTWRWPDGSLFDDGYTNWASAQPGGGSTEDCMDMRVSTMTWYDVSCTYVYFARTKAAYVCETSPNYV